LNLPILSKQKTMAVISTIVLLTCLAAPALSFTEYARHEGAQWPTTEGFTIKNEAVCSIGSAVLNSVAHDFFALRTRSFPNKVTHLGTDLQSLEFNTLPASGDMYVEMRLRYVAGNQFRDNSAGYITTAMAFFLNKPNGQVRVCHIGIGENLLERNLFLGSLVVTAHQRIARPTTDTFHSYAMFIDDTAQTVTFFYDNAELWNVPLSECAQNNAYNGLQGLVQFGGFTGSQHYEVEIGYVLVADEKPAALVVSPTQPSTAPANDYIVVQWSPQTTGDPTTAKWSVDPALPSPLQLNALTGQLSGIIDTAQAAAISQTVFNVTAANQLTFSLTISADGVTASNAQLARWCHERKSFF